MSTVYCWGGGVFLCILYDTQVVGNTQFSVEVTIDGSHVWMNATLLVRTLSTATRMYFKDSEVYPLGNGFSSK